MYYYHAEVTGADAEDTAAILEALTLLMNGAPMFGRDVFNNAAPIVRVVRGCEQPERAAYEQPKSIACTNTRLGRAAILSLPKGSQSTKELAITLWHEIVGHWWCDTQGHYHLRPHTNEGPARYLTDWIYEQEVVLDRLLSAYLRQPMNRIRVPALAPVRDVNVFEVIATGFLLGAGIGFVARALSGARR